MWKKNDPRQPSDDHVTPSVAPRVLDERATIGLSILVKGDLSGEEHLLIQGRVEGQINLDGKDLTVGSRGRVKADIHAKVISVEGEVRGNLFGEEKIIIRKTGNVKGNLVAPRVSLEDGATFKGSIDMGVKTNQKGPAGRSSSRSQSNESTSRSAGSAKSLESTPKTLEMAEANEMDLVK